MVPQTDTEPAASQRGLTDHRDALDQEAPRVKLVAKTLEYHGELTLTGVAENSRLSPESAREAVTRLEEIGVVERRPYFQDLRKDWFSIREAGSEG